MRNSGVLKTGLFQEGWKMWGLKPLFKQYGERIRRNPVWKQKIISRGLNISTQSSCASSGTINTWERTSAQRDTSLLLLCRRSDGKEQSVSSSGTLRRGTKIFSSWTRSFSPSRSSIRTRTRRFMLKRPLRYILRAQRCHRPSYVIVWWEVSHQGLTHFHFWKKGVKLVSERIKRTCYNELWKSLTRPSSVVRNGSSSGTQFLPKSKDDSGVAAEERCSLYQRRGLALGESRPQPPGL